MPRDLTKGEEIKESIRVTQGMIRGWVDRGDATKVAAEVETQRAIIAAAQARVATLQLELTEAPARVAGYRKKLKELRAELAEYTNRYRVEQLRSATKQAAGLADDMTAALKGMSPEELADVRQTVERLMKR